MPIIVGIVVIQALFPHLPLLPFLAYFLCFGFLLFLFDSLCTCLLMTSCRKFFSKQNQQH